VEQETDQLSIAVAMFLFVISMQVGVKSIETGVWGAYQNVLINLKDVKEDDVRQKVGIFFGRFFLYVCCLLFNGHGPLWSDFQ